MIGIVNDAGADPATWTVAHQPTEEAGTSFVGGGNISVFSDSDNKAAGWAFVDYLSQPEVQVKWFQTINDLPSVQAAWDDPALADDELLSAFGDQLADAKAPPAIATWEQVAARGDRHPDRAGDRRRRHPRGGLRRRCRPRPRRSGRAPSRVGDHHSDGGGACRPDRRTDTLAPGADRLELRPAVSDPLRSLHGCYRSSPRR